MKIPESIRIGGVEYEVRRERDVRDGDRLCYGKISFEEDAIWLSTSESMGHQRTCVTMLHEILHGILYHTGTALEIDEVTEEEVVQALAKGLYQVLEDNGERLFDLKVVEELRSELHEKLEKLGRLMDRVEESLETEDTNECT